MRPPLASITKSSLFGRPAHKPSTPKFACRPRPHMSLLAYCSVVSNRGLLGTVFSSLRRIYETAVSCNRISCMCPGYTLALSPISTLARDLEASRGPLEASLDAGLEARSVSNNTMRAMWHDDLEASRGPLASRPDPCQIIPCRRCGTAISRPLEALSRPASRRASRPDP